MGEVALSTTKDKIIRKMTYLMFRDQIHEQTSTRGIYKHNIVTGKPGIDPFKACKSLSDVKEVFLTDELETLEGLFREGCDFLLVKINKRNLTTFQQIFPYELNNSVRFIREG